MMNKQKVNVRNQMIMSILPIVYLIAFGRIKKLRKGFLFFIMNSFIGVASNAIFPWPYGIFASWGIVIPIILHFMKKWSIAWNEEIDKGMEQTGI